MEVEGLEAPASQTDVEAAAADEAGPLRVTTTREWLSTVNFDTSPLERSELRLFRRIEVQEESNGGKRGRQCL